LHRSKNPQTYRCTPKTQVLFAWSIRRATVVRHRVQSEERKEAEVARHRQCSCVRMPSNTVRCEVPPSIGEQAERRPIMVVSSRFAESAAFLFALALQSRFLLQQILFRHGEHHAECVAHAFGVGISGDLRGWVYLAHAAHIIARRNGKKRVFLTGDVSKSKSQRTVEEPRSSR
jgi:hypothetical protein